MSDLRYTQFHLHHRFQQHLAECFLCIATDNFSRIDLAEDAVHLCTFPQDLSEDLFLNLELFLYKPDQLL